MGQNTILCLYGQFVQAEIVHLLARINFVSTSLSEIPKFRKFLDRTPIFK